mgnify:FL=1
MTSLLTLITPTNLEVERDKFLASSTYNPTFHYIWQNEDTQPTFKSSNKFALWSAIKSQDNKEIVKQASKLFEVKIDDVILSLAQKTTKTKGPVSTGSAQSYAKLLQDALTYFGIDDIQIIITDEGGFNARPNHKDRIITISKYSKNFSQ